MSVFEEPNSVDLIRYDIPAAWGIRLTWFVSWYTYLQCSEAHEEDLTLISILCLRGYRDWPLLKVSMKSIFHLN